MLGPPCRKSTAVRREEIVDAALAVLGDPAAGRFSTRVLAARVGLTQGALFRHFPSLDAVLQAVMTRIEDLLFAGFPPADEDPIERLGAFFRQRTQVLLDRPEVPRLLLSDDLVRLAGAPLARRLLDARCRTQAFLWGCLEEAKARRILAPGVPVAVAALLVTGAILALVRGHGGASTGRAAQSVWTLLERTLRAPKTRQGPARRSGRVAPARARRR